MNYTVIKKLPQAAELIQAIPLSQNGYQQIARDRQEVKNILEGKESRLLIVVGPCSAWPQEAVIEYAKKLLEINKKVKHALKLLMRVYIQKPRTTKGWTGPVNQPNPFAYPDIESGMKYARKMMVDVIELGLGIADEALFTHNAEGFLELLSWVAIGARSTEDQEHRIFASAINCAVGLKNPTHGALDIGVNSIIAAQHPHVFSLDGYEIQTHGNPHAHLVLRGGNHLPNYSISHLQTVKHHMDIQQIKNPAVLIDVSHDNCLVDGKKAYNLQPKIILDIIESLEKHPELKNLIKGFMIESFLKEGNQKINPENPRDIDMSGLSITDPCISFEQTEELLLKLSEKKSCD